MEGISFDCKPSVNRGITTVLSHLLNENNPYVRDFNAETEWIKKKIQDFEVLIHADKKPGRQHSGCYNAPTTNEIAVVLVDQEIGESRDIVISTKEGRLHRIADSSSIRLSSISLKVCVR